MWGFTILMTTILEAYGSLFSRNFHIPVDRYATTGWASPRTSSRRRCWSRWSSSRSSASRTRRRARNAPVAFLRQSHRRGVGRLFMISMVIITLLLYRGAQINTGHFPLHSGSGVPAIPPSSGFNSSYYHHFASSWTFASKIVAGWLAPLGVGVNSVLEAVFLLLNVSVIAGFLVFVSYSKHLHIFLAPDQRRRLASSARARGSGQDARHGHGATSPRTRSSARARWRTSPGSRCSTSPPAPSADAANRSVPRGRPASRSARSSSSWDCATTCSRRPIDCSRARASNADVATLVPTTIDPDVLWSCTTCGSCVEQCPVDIEHVDAIIDMRRFEVMMESRFPTEAGCCCATWRIRATRGDWVRPAHQVARRAGLRGAGHRRTIPDDVEYLYWVGCAGSLDERGSQAGRLDGAHAAPRRRQLRHPRTPRVLHRRPGASHGQRVPLPGDGQGQHRDADDVGAKKIVASCPHCFNTMKNEYPGLGGDYELIHHAQLLSHLVANGQTRPRRLLRGHRHLPRPLLPGSPQPGLRRAARTCSTRSRGHHRRDGPVPREGLLLRGRGRAHVDGRDDRQARQHGPDRRGARHRRRHHLDGLSVLHDHARRRRQGQRPRRRVSVMDISQVVERSLRPEKAPHRQVA
jgi:ferredoxin